MNACSLKGGVGRRCCAFFEAFRFASDFSRGFEHELRSRLRRFEMGMRMGMRRDDDGIRDMYGDRTREYSMQVRLM